MTKRVSVAVGVVIGTHQQSPTADNSKDIQETDQAPVTMFFVCRRKAHQHQGNKWEFPGGKVEKNESVEQALCRELEEEIGIKVKHSFPLTRINFDYSEKQVELNVLVVDDFSGQAHGAEGQESQWLSFEELTHLDFPAANRQIIEKLALLGY